MSPKLTLLFKLTRNFGRRDEREVKFDIHIFYHFLLHLKLVYCQFVLELRVHDKRRVEKDCKVHWDLLS